MLYFDHNATHPLSEAAREAWLRATRDFIGNPSSPHRLGARAEKALEQARERLAAWIGCRATEVIWTSGATEANNAALHHAAISSPEPAWISAIEHPSVMETARRHFAGRWECIPVSRDGAVDLSWIADQLKTRRPALIAVMAANNETGVLQPWREVAALCCERNVRYFCDAAQWLGKLPAAGLGAADFLSGCAHKFGGPTGVGFLKVPAGFLGQMVGGLQEDGRRAGTENLAGVLAMIAALEERESAIDTSETGKSGAVSERLAFQKDFEGQLVAALPGTRILGTSVERLWNTVSAILPEQRDCRQRWVVKLDKLGFAVSTGSACASGKEEPSHVLAAMGLAPTEAGRVLRFSSGWDFSTGEWNALLEGLIQARGELFA